ncbi:hypothetical protein [Calothrix sp. 336/3]|nr:hypothetical protein [Calothrix sp. 336/3]
MAIELRSTEAAIGYHLPFLTNHPPTFGNFVKKYMGYIACGVRIW